MKTVQIFFSVKFESSVFFRSKHFFGQSWSYCYCIHPSIQFHSWFEQLGLCLVFVFCQHKSHRFRFGVLGFLLSSHFFLHFCCLIDNWLVFISMRCSKINIPHPQFHNRYMLYYFPPSWTPKPNIKEKWLAQHLMPWPRIRFSHVDLFFKAQVFLAQVVCNRHFPSISPPCHAFNVHISFDHILVEVQQLILVQLVLGESIPPFFLVGELFDLGWPVTVGAPPRFQKRILIWIHSRDRWISKIAAWKITQFLYMITRNIGWISRGDFDLFTRWSPTFS